MEPRPYQLVPLLMALRQETVRLLIADDVGIGKTVESGLIAAELLAQGDARGLVVLCSPALAEQWRAELRGKFGIDAELVLASTIGRLERSRLYGQSVFRPDRNYVVSTDFIKSPATGTTSSRTAPTWSSSTRRTRASRTPARAAPGSSGTPCCARSPTTRTGTCCW